MIKTSVEKVQDKVMSALKTEAKKQTLQRGFQSGVFKIDSDDWDNLLAELCIKKKDHNCYEVSLPSFVKVCIQPGLAVMIGAASGTLVGGSVGGVSGATVGGILGSVVPGPGTVTGAVVGGLIGTAIGGGVGSTGGGVGGAIIGKGVKKYKHSFYISADDIFSQLSENFISDSGKVYATVKI